MTADELERRLREDRAELGDDFTDDPIGAGAAFTLDTATRVIALDETGDPLGELRRLIEFFVPIYRKRGLEHVDEFSRSVYYTMTSIQEMIATYELYVLIHPEPYLSNDITAAIAKLPPDARDLFLALEDIDTIHADLVTAAALKTQHHLVIADDIVAEDLIDEDGNVTDDAVIVGNLPADGWQVAVADRFNVDEITTKAVLATGATDVLIGGFHRDDCVQRSIDALRRAGINVTIDEPTTLPLTEDAAGAWLIAKPAAANS